MNSQLYSSRKFILCSLTLLVAMIGWVYALLYKPDILATVSAFAASVLGIYSGVNVADSIAGARYGYARKQEATGVRQ